jgi:hypothetical protein
VKRKPDEGLLLIFIWIIFIKMKTMKLSEIVKSLIESGATEAQIAIHIGCGQSTVHRIKNGVDASYTKGKALELPLPFCDFAHAQTETFRRYKRACLPDRPTPAD